jgi:membrane protein implicated in regulation of membrane protease activity
MTTSEIAGGAIALAAPGPLLAAAAADNGVVVPVWVITTSVSVLVGVVGFLLKRSLDAVDGRLEKLDAHASTQLERQARLEERVSNIETTVGRLADTKEK